MIAKRWRSGSRMMLLSMSRSTGADVFSTGSRYCPSPSPSSIFLSGGAGSLFGLFGCVGWQATNFSPISDWSLIVQKASCLKSRNAGSSIRSTIAALFCGVTPSSSIVPTFAPATFTSSPGTRKLALSKIARTR